MKHTKYSWLLPALFLLFACVGAIAQQNSEIVGTITDQTGAAVPGAALTLTQNETGFVYNTVSNATGGYVFPGLNVGTYTLQVSAKGFEGYTASGLTLNVSQTLGDDVKLVIGAATVNVAVTADALQVQTDSNTVSTLISGEQVTEIATENRNFAALAALGMGVSSMLPDSNTPTSVASSFSISVNGLRQSHNIWLIDGGEADDRGGAGGMDIMPSMDAIEQFEVLASNYPPDYGISSGATMSLALKSGTQKFHGEAYEFLRNDDFDANAYFNKYNGATAAVPKLRQNIFGANAGGPVFIPHVYNQARQKTFFFYNQEWRKIIQGSQPNIQNTIPTLDRPVAGQPLTYVAPSYSPGQILYVPRVADPTYTSAETADGLIPGTPFPGRVIPGNLIDSNAALYLSLPNIPKPSQAGQDVVASSATNPIDVSEEIVRVDHKLNDRWQILGHYIHDSVNQGFPDADLGWNAESYNTVSSTLSNPSNSAAVKMSGTLSPNLLLEASFNYDGNIINIVNADTANKPSGWTAQVLFNNGSPNLPGVAISGTNIGVNEQTGYGTWHNAAEDYSPKLDVSYTNGKHAMKFGFSYNRYTKNQQLQANPGGDFSFSRNQTGFTCLSDDAASQANPGCFNSAGAFQVGQVVGGDPWISLSLGLSNSYSQAEHLPIRHYVNQTTSGYVNDNWKVNPNLSLQLGLRYDALPHAWERQNQTSNFDPATYINTPPTWNADGSIAPGSTGVYVPVGSEIPFYLNGIQIPGQNGYPKGLVTNDYNTLQPRVGFSYDLNGRGKTVLRGGLGIFFERMQGNDIYSTANGNVPNQYVPGLSNNYYSNPHCAWSSLAPTSEPANCLSVTTLPVLPANLFSLDETYRAPAVAQFSLGIQHELKPSVIWVVQYVGNNAWHQNIEHPINNFPLNTPNNIRAASASNSLTNAGNANAYRSYQGFSSITQVENTTNGTYNGLQTSIRVQNKWGLSGELDYTYSHVIDVTSTDLQSVANPWNFKYDKAGGAFDRRQILQGNYIYKLPIFNHGTGLLHSALGGWELSGTAIFETGNPFAAGLGGVTDPIGLGGGYTDRANVVGKINYHHKVANWFDTSSGGPLGDPIPGYDGGPNLGFGNGKRDTFVGPGRVNFTTSLYKSFAVTERAHFEFRAESYNTCNHTEFSNIGTTVGGGQYGQANGTYDPRVLELGGKFIF
jgi:hypothetical protein